MGTFLHKFDTTAEFEAAYNNPKVYREPWVSLTEGQVNFNNPNPPQPPEKSYLTFKIKSDGNIRWNAQYTGYRTTISYSKDNGATWTDITSNTGSSAPSIPVVSGDTVLFKGNNATYSSGNSRYNSFSGTTCQFEVEGNMMSLIYGDDFKNQTTLPNSGYTFYDFFLSCTGLTSSENLVLPATNLINYCYSYMFYGCTSLTTAPELPATTLANYCYYYMFGGCSLLTTAPELPATNLAQGCYNNMFNGCSRLTTAPELPATNLTSACYYSMFSGCTSLTTPPELPATTLAQSCYSNMFGKCYSLTTAPELPATTLAQSCYSGMFYGCTGLNYIKCLATNILANSATTSWVSGVSATGTFVKDASTIEWTTGKNGIPNGWVVENIGFGLSKKTIGVYESGISAQITVISTDNSWTATTDDAWISLSQYSGPKGETTITVTVSSTSTPRNGKVSFTDGNKTVVLTVVQNNNIFKYLTFKITGDGNIRWRAYSTAYTTTISYSKDNGSTWTDITSSTGGVLFSVVSGDTVLFKGNNVTYSSGSSRYNCFTGTTCQFEVEGNIMSLIYGDDFKNQTTLPNSGYTFYYLFWGCTGLKSAKNLVLPATNLAQQCYQCMFYTCRSLTTAPELPATTLAQGCYGSMFYGCSGLTTAPELPATTLPQGCYQNMFGNCSSLNYIKCLATNISAQYCTYNWLLNVASTGTFVKDASMTDWTTGSSGIPNKWTVQDA